MTSNSDAAISALSAQPPSRETVAPLVNTAAIVDQLPVGVLVCSLSQANVVKINFINAFARELFEIKEDFALPATLDKLVNEEETAGLMAQILDSFQLKLPGGYEWSVMISGVERHLSVQLTALNNSAGTVHQVLCSFEDQTAEKLAERNLLHHAFHDALTGQPNRVLFRNRLEEAVAECQRDGSGYGVGVLIINIDRFQQINDSFGHSAGDRFLVAMSTTLKRCIRTSDTLARLSGDEFAVLVSRCDDLDEVTTICDRIHNAMLLPYDLDGNEVFTSVSIGVATTLSSSTHPEDLIRDADFAMHGAKDKGKARSEIYMNDTHQRARSQFHLETELRRAVDRDELELAYQPLVGLEKEGVIGFEALTRWNHKERGPVSPVEFIPLAEETGIIVSLGRWALYKACARAKLWMETLGPEYARPVNVNVSGIQFARDNVAEMIEDTLEETGLPGFMLRVELTESAFMSNPEKIAKTLNQVRDYGVKVALDDFGTGYSSLNSLHAFPIDIIKIDRSFINQMKVGNETYEILRMIAMLADKLGHEIVAEGLEKKEQIEILRSLNFDSGQGYYFSKPVPHTEATAFLTDPLPWLKG